MAVRPLLGHRRVTTRLRTSEKGGPPLSPLSQTDSPVPSSVVAGLLIVARTYLRRLELSHPTTAEILAATGASKGRAYEIAARLITLLASLVGPVGRPPRKSVPAAPGDGTYALAKSVLGFLIQHPGAATPGFYAEVFKKRILELRESHAELDLATFADAVGVPPGTIEDWHRPGSGIASSSAPPPPRADGPTAASARIQTIIDAYRSWHGTFTAFCGHVREHLRIEYGRSLIARILETHGERRPKRRPGRAPDERATRDSFELYFPGAQWVGDGMTVSVSVNDRVFEFNLEFDVDAASGAIVGASVRDEEDAAAVIEAFADGVATTGAAPIALLLDNRPSNHTEEVQQALGDTIRIRSTPGRGPSKAHVEGGFGLFSQEGPPLEIEADSLRELAREVLRLHVTAWTRTLNHRSRADRKGKSRVEIYRAAQPTPEQIEEARQKLEELRRKQELARATRLARTDPAMVAFLDAAFERLGLSDPERHIRASIAGYTRDAIVDGVAVFEGKLHAGTLPPGADGRYLLGIVRNLQHAHESTAITEALLRLRIEVRDSLLAPLIHEQDQLLQRPSLTDQLRAMVDRAMTATRNIDRRFWLIAAADRIAAQPDLEQQGLFRAAARRIHAAFAASTRERAEAERIIMRGVWSIG